MSSIESHFGSTIQINSGYRCEKRNREVGGASQSQHTYGAACDFVIKGNKTKEVYDYVIATYGSKPFGIAKKLSSDPNQGFVHLDTRGSRARWTYPGSVDLTKTETKTTYLEKQTPQKLSDTKSAGNVKVFDILN